MYTFDIDWSPSVKLGHNKVENKLQEAHERALRSNAIKRKREEAFEQEQTQKEELERLEHTSVNHPPDDNKSDKIVDDNKVCYYTGLLNQEMLN